MNPNGIAVIAGVTIAAIAAIGIAIYEAFRDNSENCNKHEERPKPRAPKWTSPEQKGARCESCKLSLAGQEIRRLPCKHVFHDACILWLSNCPFPGCGRRIPGSWQ